MLGTGVSDLDTDKLAFSVGLTVLVNLLLYLLSSPVPGIPGVDV